VVLLLGKPLDFTLRFGQGFSKGCRTLRAEGDVAFPELGKQKGWFDEVRAALAYRPSAWKDIQDARHPVAVCREVQKLLDAPNAALVADGGEFGQWAQACLQARRRVINGVAGSIGSALPFAAAAKRAFSDAPAVPVLGRGTRG